MAMPPIVFVIPAQIGIAKNGGVSIRCGAPLRVERSGNSVVSRLKRTASLYSATVKARFSSGSPRRIGQRLDRIALVQCAAIGRQLRIGRDLRRLAGGLPDRSIADHCGA
jgi:hypothetical protein